MVDLRSMTKTASTRAIESPSRGGEGSEGGTVLLEGTRKRASTSLTTECHPKKTKLAVQKMPTSRATRSSASLASPRAPA
ncbi:hypothetical protein C4D60_Mb08t06360 [Musa balbisiana]|uniref:Uncharacterized protein n=1 Tax=Musa balbisiana TaxID=52838 RepID=A0A4S8K1S2_MUSBA|nr:hypothetical protein C4D60_Mb08t06360 [Musa balbisiana]